jgi:hypothetical protein
MFLFAAIMLALCSNMHAENPGQSSHLSTQLDTIPLDGVEGRMITSGST